MLLAEGMYVQRKDKNSNHWSTPFLIDTPEKLRYHDEFVSMDYEYREVDKVN